MGNIRMNSPSYERYCNIEEERKKERRKEKTKKKILTFICDTIIAIILGIVIGLLTGCGNPDAENHAETVQIPQSEAAVTTEPAADDDTAIDTTADDTKVQDPAADVTAPATETTAESEQTDHQDVAAHAGPWHDSSKPHDINLNSILNYDGNAIFNFNDTVAVGVCGLNGIISTAETESGYILSVIDNDSVKVTFYNNGIESVVPVKLLAEMSSEDYIDETGATEYIIDGYGDCSDGFGLIQMTLSNGRVVRAGVLREDGKLYAANFTTNPVIAENNVNFRIKMEPILAENNITPDNQTYTDPIYYPIVPASANEKTDVDFWVNQANELVQDDWTDAHKVEVFYEFIIDNFAYDYWVISSGSNSRTFYNKDYTGKYFTSKTHVGVCEDFANILAIMCRAQNIPATKIYTGRHAWTYIYIADYGRWIVVDATKDLAYGCYSEDVTDWTSSSNKRYTNFDNVSGSKISSNCNAGIGNQVDMERYGKVPVEMQ